MKVELNLRTVAVLGIVVAGFVAGGVYLGNYYSKKTEEKAVIEAVGRGVDRALTGASQEVLDCRKKRAEQIKSLATAKAAPIHDAIKGKYADKIKQGTMTDSDKDNVYKELMKAYYPIIDAAHDKPESLVQSGFIKNSDLMRCE